MAEIEDTPDNPDLVNDETGEKQDQEDESLIKEDFINESIEEMNDEEAGPSVQSVDLEEFGDANILTEDGGESDKNNLDIILDISIPIAVELGSTNMLLKDVLTLTPGSIIELNKLAGDTVDLMIRGKLIAKGEVVVVDDNFGMRITSICGQEERIKNLT